jgi:superfamily II DNA/RNA helicase
VSMLILDEADRLLDLGFEADLRMALSLLRKERSVMAGSAAGSAAGSVAGSAAALRQQRTLLFSATFSPSIRALASDLLNPSALRITVQRPQSALAAQRAAAAAEAAGGVLGSGSREGAELTSATSVTQRFEVHRGKGAKPAARRRLLALLCDHLEVVEKERTEGDEDSGDEEEEEEEGGGAEEQGEEEEEDGAATEEDEEGAGEAQELDIGDAEGGGAQTDERPRVVVFALYKLEARQLTEFLTAKGLPAVALHGDMGQKARGEAMSAFRSGAARVLVATDVAARGLDVKHVNFVINTSLGMSLENYVHRVGRCGRAGATGVATTFVVDGDEGLVPPLIPLLERSRQSVPLELVELARKAEAEAAKAAARPGAGAADSDDDEDEEDERTRMQIANREKQMAQQRDKKAKGMNMKQRGGGGGGGGRRRR